MLRLDQLEALYYELQLQLYDIQAEVLRCEELLLTAQLQSLRRQMTGEPLVCFFLKLNVGNCSETSARLGGMTQHLNAASHYLILL